MALNNIAPDDTTWANEGKTVDFSQGATYHTSSIGDTFETTKKTETMELYAYTLGAAETGVNDGIQPTPGAGIDSASYVYSSFISDPVVNSYTIVRAFESTVRIIV